MAVVVASPSASTLGSPKKGAKPAAGAAKKSTESTAHPKYEAMIKKAIVDLKDRRGASRQAIVKYILANFDVGTNAAQVNLLVKQALRRGLTKGAFKHSKPTAVGASGRFRVGDAAKAEKKPKVKKAAATKSPSKAKKSAGSKTKASTAKKVAKKSIAKKSPKSVKKVKKSA